MNQGWPMITGAWGSKITLPVIHLGKKESRKKVSIIQHGGQRFFKLVGLFFDRGEFLKKMVVLCQQGFYKVI